MPVFFVHSHAIHDETITIQGPLHSHLTKSLRYRPGDVFWCGDVQRQRYHIRITAISADSLTGNIIDRQASPPSPRVSIMLGLSILKGDHMNWAVQKATELGVQTIVPLITHRGIVRPETHRVHSYQARWQRIALDAAQQSERWDFPQVNLPCQMDTFLRLHPHEGQAFILIERGNSNTRTTLALNPDSSTSLLLLSGPEGGWSEEEREQARQNHYREVTLGTTIYRAETAPLVALSLIQFQLGSLG